MNVLDNAAFTGSLPSEIGLLTELVDLTLGKWKYLVDHLHCFSTSCVANHDFRLF